MNIKHFKLKEVKEYENNPRNNDKAVEAVAESIKKFGFKVPIILDKDKTIVAGHTRLKAAKLLELEKVPCVIADDLSEDEIKAFRLADNKVSEIAEWDFSKLEEELRELQHMDMDLFGFSDLPSFEIEETEDENFTEVMEEVKEAPIAKLGEVWQLGRHRLIVGDCTSEETIKELMNDKEVDLLLTDPPYNVAIENADGLTIKNDDMEDSAFLSFLTSSFKVADKFMKQGAGFYIWHADSEGLNFRLAVKNVGWLFKQNLIWVKNAFSMGRQDYQWRHEPCLYGWKAGASHYFIKNRNLSTILEFDKPKKNDLHPTMKPIEMIKEQIRNSTKKDNIVLDIFGGSGTTLLACEELDRICYTSELDEVYASVIIKRWEELTGDKAKKVN